MILFSLLSTTMRSIFLLVTLLICFTAIICGVYSIYKKQIHYLYCILPCFITAYFIWQVMMDVSEFYLGHTFSKFCMNCAELPWIVYGIILSVVSAILIMSLRSIIFYAKSHITPDAIRICADSLPCGICYWYENGRIAFANECMANLCFRLINNTLQNGLEFDAVIGDPIMHIDGRVWSFAKRTVSLDGTKLFEMIATDITELYSKTALLESEKMNAERYNEMLHEYNIRIDEAMRREEIMKAKINIHDEMNKLMLTTVSAGNEGMSSTNDVFALWKNNALLLCREASYAENKFSADSLNQIAKALNINLVWKNSLPEGLSKEQIRLFYSSAQEALANAFKHAEAKSLEIDFDNHSGHLVCHFINNGKIPKEPVVFSGGLSNLSVIAAMQDAKLSVEISDSFTLALSLPLRL